MLAEYNDQDNMYDYSDFLDLNTEKVYQVTETDLAKYINLVLRKKKFPLISRHHTPCQTGDKCVPTSEVCHGGEPLCSDRSDIELCGGTSLTTTSKCIKIDSSSEPYEHCVSDTVQTNHDECFYRNERNDGHFNCLARTDETSKIIFAKSDIASVNENQYSELQICNDSGPGDIPTGLKCERENGGNCLMFKSWCRESSNSNERKICLNSGLSTVNPTLCSNTTFWRDIPCTQYVTNSQGQYIAMEGKRCHGTLPGQCTYPVYIWPYGWNMDLSPQDCDDFSDRIHRVNTSCNNQHSFTPYCRNIFCNPTHPRYSISNCDRCRDPHHCKESCATPSPVCIACTNSTYSFTCLVDGRLSCLNQALVCDGVPHCDGDQPADEDFQLCTEKLIERRGKKGTFKCESIHFNETVYIFATPCDDNIECKEGADEGFLCKHKDKIATGSTAFFIVFVVVVIMLTTGWKYNKKENEFEMTVEGSNSFLTFCENIENGNVDINDKVVIINMSSWLIRIIYQEQNKDTRKTQLLLIYSSIRSIQNGDAAELNNWLKSNIDPSLYTDFCDEIFPGWIATITPNKLRAFLEKLRHNQTFQWFKFLIGKISKILRFYLDLFKDVYLLVVITIASGGIAALISFPTAFTTVVSFFI